MSYYHLTVLTASIIVPGIVILSVVGGRKKERKAREAAENNANATIDGNGAPSAGKVALAMIKRRRSIFPKQYTGNPVPQSIIRDMLEGARWAPTHKLTQPWVFVIFETKDSKESLGVFLADQYKISKGDSYDQKKYEKKITSVNKSSHIIAICSQVPSCDDKASSLNPEIEEISSVAMAVQNMHLIASAYNVGAYWSSSAIYDSDREKERALVNPSDLRDYLNLSNHEPEGTMCICLGWLFIGEFENKGKEKKWPESRRNSMDYGKVVWR